MLLFAGSEYLIPVKRDGVVLSVLSGSSVLVIAAATTDSCTLLGTVLLSSVLLQLLLQVEAVLLDVLADAFTLHLPAEAAQGLLERLVLSDGDEDQR